MSKFLSTTAAAAVLAASAIVGSSAPATSAEFNFRMHTFIPPVANPAKTFLAPWAKKINKASGGRINVKPFWAMQLGGKPTQLLDQVRDGVVDIVWILPGFTTGRMPKIETFELPFIHKDALSTTLALQDFQDKHLGKELSEYHTLLTHAHDGELFMTKKPITKMSDLKGRKLRAANRSGVWLLQSLGVDAVASPLPRIPPMLAKGTITGVMLPYEIAPSVKMHELTTYFTELAKPDTRLGTAVFTFLMNKKSYAKLPADLKKVIDANSGRNIARSTGENWRAIEKPGLAVMKSKKKNKFSRLSVEESNKIKKATEVVFVRFNAEMKKLGINGQELIDDARSMIAKYRK
ncbi:MAG: TRAP transporter substrate-binding protein [Rhodospirillaceae bacterium]|jgi:TRAP-type transport system periplasmic protein|nr:TRAP transporter substrate-binding protein [Rhodospirillaceae bacterium]